jgi:dihydropteroate synthase
MITNNRPVYSFHARGFKLELGHRTRLMGILNITPDSFSGDGLLSCDAVSTETSLRKARQWIKAGVDIIDVGGESTRPGASRVSVKEEVARICPVICAISRIPGACISVDTYKPEVAREAFEAGASIVNVVQGTPISSKMLDVVRKYDAGLVLMHMRGTPRTMQQQTNYSQLVQDIISALKNSVEKCLLSGINKQSIIVDPGIGFAKTPAQNLSLLRSLDAFHVLQQPLLVGTSRKSFIGQIINASPEKRLMGTAATVVCAITQGVHIVRVHDLPAIRQLTLMTDAIVNAL